MLRASGNARVAIPTPHKIQPPKDSTRTQKRRINAKTTVPNTRTTRGKAESRWLLRS